MPHYDSSSAECLVFTFKEGLLSAVAHDLKLRVTRFSLEVDANAGSVSGRFQTDSLEVVCARKEGRDDPGALRDRDRREIEKNIVNDVLHAKRHPEARFESSSVEPRGDGYQVRGTLTLHGTSRELSLDVRREGDRLVTEVPLHQPDFGIKPYRAAMGTLRVQPDVRVRLSVPAE
jgi:polyisoprenoid-binding protein YceI